MRVTLWPSNATFPAVGSIKRMIARPVVVKKDPNIQQLESSLADRLGASVRLRPGRGGKGKLEISYNSLDELDGILEHIK
jgi:ParB family chromosome partitioning protein